MYKAMEFVKLRNVNLQDRKEANKLRIMVFTEGTILGPKSVLYHFSHSSYVPIGASVERLKAWEQQGAEILYITSRKKEKQVGEIKKLLLKYDFPGEYLYYRGTGKKYKDIVEEVVPDVLIEDDCRSIGGSWQMCITYVKPEIKVKIKSIVVKEFKGIGDLLHLLSELINWRN